MKPCVICGNTHGNRVLLRARHWIPEKGYCSLANCGACGSKFYLDIAALHEPYPAARESLDNPDFILLLHHYYELVSGLDWKVPLLEVLPQERISTVLEVGCNMGVTLDYCRTAWGVDGIGLEPSTYGAGGALLLGIPIHQRLLSEADELGDRTFDLVYATEVLEHVDDPRQFLRELRSRLRPDGVLFLTTPRAAQVDKVTPLGDLLGVLSAGAHRFILSEGSLRALLVESGFTNVTLGTFGFSHIAYASDAPIEFRDAPPIHARLQRYYAERLRRDARNGGDPRIRLTTAIHAFVTGVQTGAPDKKLTRGIGLALREVFGIEIERPLHISSRLAEARSIFDFGRVVPYSLPQYLEALSQVSESVDAGEYEALALIVAYHGLRVDFQNMFVYQFTIERLLLSSRSRPYYSPRASHLLMLADRLRVSLPQLERLSVQPLDLVRQRFKTALGLVMEPPRILRRWRKRTDAF